MAKDTKSNEAKTKKNTKVSKTNTAKKTSAAQTKSAPKKKVSTTTKKSTTAASTKTKKAAATPKKATASTTKAKTTSAKNTTAKTTKPKNTKASTTKKSTQTKSPKSVEPKKKRVLEETENTTPEVVKELHIEEEPKIVTSAGETKSNEEYAPKTLLGADLPEGGELEARRARKRSYSKDALLFAIIIPVLDLLAMLFIDAYKPILLFNDMVVNYIITLILDFILIYIVTYLIDFVMGEDAVKKNRK